ncbi:MAG: hypothetical protein V4736_06845 [Bdellovibrionota bacterium]
MLLNRHSVASAASTLFFIFTAIVNPAKADNPSQSLQRVKGQSTLEAQLSQDVYDSIPVQVNYTEQVPYQVEETYTDYVSETQSQHVCHTTYENVCATEQVCHQVNNPVCDTHQVCVSGPSQQSCSTVQECGTNALGEPICKDREVCTDSGPGSPVCQNVQECRDNTQNQCSSEYRCNQVPRQSCGYENVTVQVPVQRTRIVTRYQSVTKCCHTEYQSQLIGTDRVNVQIRFPAAAALLDGEKEIIGVAMVSETQVAINSSQAVFGYKIVSQKLQGGKLIVDLAVTPKYGPNDLGKESLASVYLKVMNGKSELTMVDSGVVPRVQSSYAVTIKDKATAKVLAQGKGVSAGKREISIALAALPNDRDLTIEVQVSRQGIVLQSKISFTHKSDWDFRFENPEQFSDANLVNVSELRGQKSQTKLVLKDATAEHPVVQTQYEILLERKGGFLGLDKKDLVKATLNRDLLKKNSSGEYEIDVVQDLKLDAAEAEKQLASGKSITAKLRVIRQSPRLNDGQNIVIDKKAAKLKVK